MSSFTTMYDAIDISQIPAGAEAVAGYVDGEWATYNSLVTAFPGADHLSIAVSPVHDADCLDIETGDASPGDAADWYARQKTRGVERPCLYASASVMEAQVIPVILAAGFPRNEVRLWSAHFGAGEHLCAPATCGLMSIEADGTQWTDAAMGKSLDQSILGPGFFAAPVPVPNVPAWQETMMQALPIVKQGATGEAVRTVQGLCIARGHTIKVDGVFGPVTHGAVTAVQKAAKIGVDGVVGPQTWPALTGIT